MKRFTEIFAAGFIAFVLLALASCGESAGLGSTVDTEAPKLSIEYPPAAAAVKGTFVFAGTCSDDKGVSRVEVSIKNLDTGVSYGKSLANVNNSLTWELSVNKENDSGFDLPDGKYQFEAIAYDKSGRSSGVSSRQFDIDNTPPVFVITKPGVDRKAFVSNGSLSKYGSLFTIDGTIADDHSIATMDVTVYDKNGNLVSTDPYSEQEISTTGGTSVTIARYIADGQDEVNKRYKEIYDYSEEADSSGNKIFSCTITIADSTKEYKNPGDSGIEGGNSTSVVYLYDDVYEDYMSAKKGAGLSVNDFRSVLNGTASDDSIKGKGLKDFSVNQVRTALANFAKDTTKIEDNSLSFSLNPNADPTYTISGFNLNYNDAGTAIAAGTNKAMGEQPLTIIVNAGLDQVNIDPKSLKVYIKKIIDADKAHITKKALNNSIADLVTKVSELEINLSNAVESSNSDAQKEAEAQLSVIDGWKLLLDNSKDTSSSDKTVTLSTSLPASNYIEANAYYAIVVTGCDKDGVKLSQSKNYGFMGTVSAVPPSANFTSPKELSYFANSKYSEGSETDKLVFTGTATENNAGMTLREITATLTVSDESTGQKVPGSIQVTITGDSDNQWTEAGGLSCVYDEQTHTNLWTFIPSLCGKAYQEIMAEAEGLMYMYTVNIKVTGTSALTYEMTRSVHIDTTKPVVRITSVTPVVSGAEYFGAGDENTYINGSVSLKGSIEEPNLTEVKYDIWASTDLEKTLTAEDSILNELKTFTEGKINGSLGRIYTINQEIDTELITKFFISKEKIEKDQPIQAKIVVTAIDTVGNEGNYSSSDSNDGKDLIIYQETNRPKITLGNADSKITAKSGINVNSNLFGTTNNNKLSISVSDDDYIASYEIFICKEDDEFAAEANRIETPKKTSAALNYVLPEEEGVYKVKVVARDFIASEINTDQNNPTGIMTVGPFLIAVDSGAPTLNLSNPQNGTFVSRANGIDGGVKGTVSKREGTTITGFVYKSGDKEKKPLVNLETVVINKEAVNEVYDWSGIINKMPEKEQGESFKLEITATDIYGQYSIVTVNLGIDETAPTITLNADGEVVEVVDGKEQVKTGARIIETNPNYSVKNGKNRYLVSGTWCDEYTEGTGNEARTVQGTGTSELYCAYATELDKDGQPNWNPLNGTKEVPLPIPGTAKSTAETSFNIYIPLTECGNFAYKIWGKDVAGNVTDPVVYSGISVDLGAPKITKTSGDLPKYVKKGETLTITGSYEDSYGIKELSVITQFKPFGKDSVFAEVTTEQNGYTLADTRAEDGKSGSFLITVNPASLQSEGEWKFDLTVTDLADRTASITNLSTIVDTVAPKGLHAMDKSNKDLYFRVGSNNNDDITKNTHPSLWNDDKDRDVGGKYSENTYGNANTIKIRGNFKDDGTGLAMIYYKVISSNSALDYDTLKAHANSFLANYSKSDDSGYTGYFAPLAADKIETKRVFFTSDDGKIAERTLDADGNGKDLTDEAGNKVYFLESSESIVNSKGETKYYTEIESNYDSVLSGFTEGINYLILVAVDNAGNAALDSVIADKEYLNASINVDTQVPEASGDDLGIKYTNGSANSTTEIKGKATDAAAGVRDIVISVNNKKINIGDTLENTETYGSLTIDSKTVVNGVSTWTWTAVLKNDKIFAGLAANTASQTFSVTATVTDNAGAGNSQSYGVASIIADNKVPTVELKTPTDRDTDIPECQINGKISLEGTINDENVLPETAIAGIQYRKSGGESAWTEVPGINLSGNYTFKVEDFDTTKLEDGTYELRAVAVDKSGNTGYSDAQTVIISQDSDRPKVNFNNIDYSTSLSSYLLKHGKDAQLTGRISDDDSLSTAVVKYFYMTENPVTAEKDSNGNYTFTETLSDNSTRTAVNCVTDDYKVTTGDFTFKPTVGADGTKTFYICIVDNEGEIFYTTYTSVSETVAKNDYLKNPKIFINGDRPTKTTVTGDSAVTSIDETVNDTKFTYKSDSLNPEVTDGRCIPYSSNGENAIAATDASGDAFELNKANSSLNASFIAGGSKRRYVKFTFKGNDASGVEGMTVEFSSSEGNNFQKLRTAASIAGEKIADTFTTSGSITKTNNGDSDASWTTGFVDTSTWGTEQITAKIKVYDRVGLATTGTYSFTVDNTAPTIAFSTVSGQQLTGTLTIQGSAIDNGLADTVSIKWLIPTIAQVNSAPTSSESARFEYLKTLNWNEALDEGKTVKSWEFTFDGENITSTDAEKSSYIWKGGNPKLDVYDTSAFANPVNGVYPLKVYFMAEDNVGNYTINESYVVNHDPDGDRPKLTFTYPTKKDDYDKSTAEDGTVTKLNYATLGNTIRTSGSAQIPNGDATVKEIYLQLDGETGTFTKAYAENLKKDGIAVYTVVNALQVLQPLISTEAYARISAAEPTEATLKEFGFASKDERDAWWGIKANGTASWNFSINSMGELNPESGTTDVKLRACGINSNGKFGAWTVDDDIIHIHIDNNVPTIEAKVNQYASLPTTASPTSTASMAYDPDMYLRGQWYLSLVILDESGLDSVTYKDKIGNPLSSSDYKEFTYEPTVNGVAKKGKKVFIKMSSESGELSYTVTATDTDKKPTTQKFTFNIDNTAPTLESLVGNETALADNNVITDSSYVYTIGGSSLDSGSGVAEIAFYYMRKKDVTPMTGNKTEVLFDPLVTAASSGDDIFSGARISMPASFSTVETDGIDQLSFTQGNETYCLYARKKTGSMTPSTFTASTDFDAHVRKGGLIKIAGLMRKITGIDKNAKKVTFSPEATEGSESIDAWFPIAQVIDSNDTPNQNSDNPFLFTGSGKSDDGDTMPETFISSGASRSWTGTIHSNNMPDGPVTLVILAFDNAGNVNGTSFNMMISNNAPRLAKVFLATDLNKNNSYDANEFETYNIAASTGSNKDVYSLTTNGFSKYVWDSSSGWTVSEGTRKAFKIKKGLAVMPEIVGGNGDIKLVFNKADKTTVDDGKQTGTGSAVLTNSGTLSLSKDQTGASAAISGNYWALTDLGNDAASQIMSFTFWDSTEERVAGSDTQYTFLRVNDFVIDQVDDISPNVVVEPFGWHEAGSGTYTDSENVRHYKNNLYYAAGSETPLGHIELTEDLPEATFKDSNKNSTTPSEYDRDPKVSGKIVIRGTAYDETYLKSLKFTMTDFESSTTTPIVMGNYGGSSWTAVHGTALSDTNFYEVTVENEFFDQKGHKVKWQVAIDTEELTSVAKLDAAFTVEAEDYKGNKASEDKNRPTTGETYEISHNPSYVMDVVPYITNVKRKSSFNTNRARSGATPLLRGETENTIEGFNFNWYAEDASNDEKAKYSVSIVPNKNESGTALAMTKIALSGKNLTFTVPATAKDGYLAVKVNNVQSLNNLNDDSKAYNKENTENVSSTDYWTDTRHIRIWQNNTGDYFKDSTLPIYPSMAMGTGGTLYASFSNYSDSAVYYSTVGASGTRTKVFYGYDPPEETDICVSGTGTVNVVYNANYHGGQESSWTYDTNSCGGLYMYDTNAQSWFVGRDNRKVLRFELFYHDKMLQQFKNMRVKRADSDNSGIVHVAYYDRTTNSIHYSEVASNYKTNSAGNYNDDSRYLLSVNEISWVNIDGGKDSQDDSYHRPDNYGANYDQYFNDGISSVSLTDARFEDTKRCSGTGESVGLALTKTNQYPVVVYYDATNSRLKLARATSKTPKGNVALWSVQEVLGSSDINYKTMVDYIACDIDSSGYLHIVFQNSKGQLCYIKSTNTSDNGKTKYTFGSSVVVADSATNIDLTLKGTVPYVSYLTKINSFDGMNIAFWDSTLDLNCDGTAEGGWETMTAALNYKVSNVKSCIEAHPTPASATWEAAVGFTPGDLYRVAYYVGNGSGH